MFAVPGWAVFPESLISQQADSHQPNESSPKAGSPSTLHAQPKKRKRDHGEGNGHPKISSDDLDELWNRQFSEEAKEKASPAARRTAKKDKKEKKKMKKVREESTTKETCENPSSGQAGNASAAGTPLPPQKVKKNKIKEPATNENNVSRPLAKSSDAAEALRDTGAEPFHKSSAKQEGSPYIRPQNIAKPLSAPMLPALQPQSATTEVLTPLQAKMRNKLTSARFRHLNETLYTSPSSAALDLFTSSPQLFSEYHAGFSQQVRDSWPENPVDGYIRDIQIRGRIAERTGRDIQKGEILPLPRRKTGSCTIADLGCGDAPLARGSQVQIKGLNLRFRNFDLCSPNSFVTKADISDLPLRDGEVDIAVFCLSLMGTNWVSFVEEAWRVLRGDGKGEIWVAEVKSRFGRVTRRVVENSVGKKRKPKKPAKPTNDEDELVNGEELFAEDERNPDQVADETDMSAFVKVFQRRGFALRETSVNKRNKMFVSMIFTKTGVPTGGKYKGMKWTGHGYERLRGPSSGRMKFLEGGEEDELPPEEEAKVLKPCVYKTR